MNVKRRAVSLVLATALFLVGTGVLVWLVIFADHWRGWMLMGGGLVAVVGAMWLYEDFIDATPNG
jgi:hypothetical protein